MEGRDFLFRGQSTHRAVWIEGDYVRGVYSSGRIDHKIHERNPRALGWFVKPETVSPYVNRTDRNGVKVFEGDILKFNVTLDDGEVVEDRLLVVYDDEASGFLLYNCLMKALPADLPLQEGFNDYEVIGNRWDNPDLICAETRKELGI